MTAAPAGVSERGLDDARPGRLVVPFLAAVVVALAAGASRIVSPVGPLATVAVVLLLLAIWRRPVIASVLVAAVVPAVAGLARGLPIPGFKASELLLVLCLVPLLLRQTPRWRRLNAVDVWLILVAVLGLALAVYNGTRGSALSLDLLLRQGLFPAFTFATWWVVSRGVSTRAEINTVLRSVLLVSLVPATLGLLQFLDVLGVRELLFSWVGSNLMPAPGTGNARVTGPFTIAHSFGGYLIVPLLVAAVLLLRGDRHVLRRRFLLLVVAVDAAALVVTVTVTTLAWAPVAFLVGAYYVRRFLPAVVALVLAGGLAGAAFWPTLMARWQEQTTATMYTPESVLPQTFAYRIFVWQRDYLPLLTEAAPLGMNIGPDDLLWGHTESQYVTLILRGGVGLLAVTAISFLVLYRRAARAARSETGSIGAAAAALCGIVLFLPLACVVWPYVTNAGLPQSLFGLAGAVLALSGGPPRTGRPLDDEPAPRELVGAAPSRGA